MKKIILFLLISAGSLVASPTRLLITSVTKGAGADSIDAQRILTANKLAVELTKNYVTVSDSVRLEKIKISESNKNPDTLAKSLGVNHLMSSTVAVFHSMMRADITINDLKSGKEDHGFGYAPIRYSKDGKKIYDIALVQSMQRAMMNALNDSTLYEHQPKDYKTKPAESLVIGGFMFDDNNEPLIWKIFSNKSVSSYFASETIFQAAKEADNYAVYDLNTRDSMYAAFNLYLMENFTRPGKEEMKILKVFAVQNYIYGSIKRVDNHAEVKIILARLEGDSYQIIRTEADILNRDDDESFANLIKKMTRKILFIDNGKRKTK